MCTDTICEGRSLQERDNRYEPDQGFQAVQYQIIRSVARRGAVL